MIGSLEFLIAYFCLNNGWFVDLLDKCATNRHVEQLYIHLIKSIIQQLVPNKLFNWIRGIPQVGLLTSCIAPAHRCSCRLLSTKSGRAHGVMKT